jgi:hypothetical protein
MYDKRAAEELKIMRFFPICLEPNRLAQNTASVKYQSGRSFSAHRIIVMYVATKYCKFKGQKLRHLIKMYVQVPLTHTSTTFI